MNREDPNTFWMRLIVTSDQSAALRNPMRYLVCYEVYCDLVELHVGQPLLITIIKILWAVATFRMTSFSE